MRFTLSTAPLFVTIHRKVGSINDDFFISANVFNVYDLGPTVAAAQKLARSRIILMFVYCDENISSRL